MPDEGVQNLDFCADLLWRSRFEDVLKNRHCCLPLADITLLSFGVLTIAWQCSFAAQVPYNTITYNSILEACVKCGDVTSAEEPAWDSKDNRKRKQLTLPLDICINASRSALARPVSTPGILQSDLLALRGDSGPNGSD